MPACKLQIRKKGAVGLPTTPCFQTRYSFTLSSLLPPSFALYTELEHVLVVTVAIMVRNTLVDTIP